MSADQTAPRFCHLKSRKTTVRPAINNHIAVTTITTEATKFKQHYNVKNLLKKMNIIYIQH